MGSVIVVTSGKGGVGKSTIAAGLGFQLARRGKRVLLIDMDEGLQSLDYMLKVDALTVYDIGDLLRGDCSAAQAVTPAGNCENLYLLPAPISAGAIDNAERMRSLCDELAAVFDYVLVDSPAGIDRGFQAAVRASQNALVVSTPDKVCARDAAAVAKLLRQMGADHTRLVINKVDAELMLEGVFLNIDEMIDTTGLQLIAAIPSDKQVLRAGAQGEPLQSGAAALALSNLADRLERKPVPLMDLKKANGTYYQKRKG